MRQFHKAQARRAVTGTQLSQRQMNSERADPITDMNSSLKFGKNIVKAYSRAALSIAFSYVVPVFIQGLSLRQAKVGDMDIGIHSGSQIYSRSLCGCPHDRRPCPDSMGRTGPGTA